MFRIFFKAFPSIPEHSRGVSESFGEVKVPKMLEKVAEQMFFAFFCFLQGSVRGSLECVLAEFGGDRRLV